MSKPADGTLEYEATLTDLAEPVGEPSVSTRNDTGDDAYLEVVTVGSEKKKVAFSALLCQRCTSADDASVDEDDAVDNHEEQLPNMEKGTQTVAMEEEKKVTVDDVLIICADL